PPRSPPFPYTTLFRSMCRHTVAGAALAHRAALEGSVLDHLRAGVPAVGDFGALGQLVLGGGGEVDHWSRLSVCSVYCHWLRVTAHALGMSTLSIDPMRMALNV